MLGDQLEDADARLLLRCQLSRKPVAVATRQPPTSVRSKIGVILGESLHLAAEGGNEGKGPEGEGLALALINVEAVLVEKVLHHLPAVTAGL